MFLSNLSGLNSLTGQLLNALNDVQMAPVIDNKAIEAKVIEILNHQPEHHELKGDLSVVIKDLKNISPSALEDKGNLAQILPTIHSIVEKLLFVETSSGAFFINENSLPIVARYNQNPSWGAKWKTFDLTQYIEDPQAQNMLREFLTKGTLPQDFNPFESNERYQSTIKLRDFARYCCHEELQTSIDHCFIKELSKETENGWFKSKKIQDTELVKTLYIDLELDADHSKLRTFVETDLASIILNACQEIPENIDSIESQLKRRFSHDLSQWLASITSNITGLDLSGVVNYSDVQLGSILKLFPDLQELTVSVPVQESNFGGDFESNFDYFRDMSHAPDLNPFYERSFTEGEGGLMYMNTLDSPPYRTFRVPAAQSLSQQGIELISNHCPNLIRLVTDGGTFSTLPQKLASSLQELSIFNNGNLLTIDNLQASLVKCIHCTALTSVNVPEATTVEIISCYALTSLHAPQASKATCIDCGAINSFHAPLANEVECSFSWELTSLEAPQATTIKCYGGRSIISLDAPLATTVNCSYCKSLTSVHAPLAIRVNCSDCKSLTSVHAPLATKVNSKNCPALTMTKRNLELNNLKVDERDSKRQRTFE